MWFFLPPVPVGLCISSLGRPSMLEHASQARYDKSLSAVPTTSFSAWANLAM